MLVAMMSEDIGRFVGENSFRRGEGSSMNLDPMDKTVEQDGVVEDVLSDAWISRNEHPVAIFVLSIPFGTCSWNVVDEGNRVLGDFVGKYEGNVGVQNLRRVGVSHRDGSESERA